MNQNPMARKLSLSLDWAKPVAAITGNAIASGRWRIIFNIFSAALVGKLNVNDDTLRFILIEAIQERMWHSRNQAVINLIFLGRVQYNLRIGVLSSITQIVFSMINI